MDRKTVRARWVDPHSYDAWTSVDDLILDKDVILVDSFGYEIYRDDEVTIIGLNMDFENMKASCSMNIPNCCIKEYEYVECDRGSGEGDHGEGGV